MTSKKSKRFGHTQGERESAQLPSANKSEPFSCREFLIPHSSFLIPHFVLSPILVLVIGIRLFLAWLYHVDVNPDGAIVHLMVRHVVEGGPWPVFFYGQAYMGSFEPMVSALVAKIFGFSLYAVCCGTALLGAATVLCSAFWAWRAAGRRAGLVALALLLVGLQPYIHYFASPRGGYGSLLFFTMSTLALGAHLLEREIRGAPRGQYAFLFLGIGAGIGFWSNFLTLPAVAAVGLSFLVWRGLRAVRFRIIVPALLGFLLGSIYLWLWNSNHGWASMAMGDSVGFTLVGAAKSLLLLLGPRLRELLSVDKGFGLPVTAAVIAVHALLIPAGLSVLFSRRQPADTEVRPPDDGNKCSGGRGSVRAVKALKAHVFVAAAWLVFFVLCFIASPQYANFNTPRYLLPMVPVIAWLAAVGSARAPFRALRVATLACVALSLAWQLYLLPNSFRFHAKHARDVERFETLCDALEESGVTAAYGSYLLYLVNPLRCESVICSSPKQERYAPYARQLELDPSPAVLDSFGGIGAWIPAAGGTSQSRAVHGHGFFHDIRPPSMQLAEVSLDGATITDGCGEPIREPFSPFDRRRSSMLLDLQPDSEPETVVVSFQEPIAVSAVRLWGATTPPVEWDVSVRDSADAEFRVVGRQVGRTDFFWSGPRVFWAGPQARHECRFAQETAREFRVRFFKDANHPHIAIPEIQLLRDAPECGETLAPDPSALVGELRARKIGRLYADRWIANSVYDQSGGVIWTQSPICGLRDDDIEMPSDCYADVPLSPDTAILAPLCAVPSLRHALSARHITYAEEALPPYGTLFSALSADTEVRPPVPTQQDATGGRGSVRAEIGTGSGMPSGVRFCGAYAMLASDAAWAEARLAALGPEPSLEAVSELYAKAGSSLPVLRAYAAALSRAGSTNEARHAKWVADEIESWISGNHAEFFSDVSWLGATATPSTIARGDSTVIEMAWAGNLPRMSRYMVFVHFVGPNGVRFQDDHQLEAWFADAGDLPTVSAPFFDDRELRVPADVPPGKYDLHIGIYPKSGGARVKPKTERPTRRQAIVIENFLTVQ